MRRARFLLRSLDMSDSIQHHVEIAPQFRERSGMAYDLTGMSRARENHPLGPDDLRALFPVRVRIDNLWMTLIAST